MKQKASPNEPAAKKNSAQVEETESQDEVLIPHALTVKQLAEILDIHILPFVWDCLSGASEHIKILVQKCCNRT